MAIASASLSTLATIRTTATDSSHVSGESLRHHNQRGIRSRLHYGFRVRLVDYHAGAVDHHSQQPGQGSWWSAAPTHRDLQRLCKWRYIGQPDDSANPDDQCHRSSPISGNPYTITASDAVDADYNISYVNGTLLVINDPGTTIAMSISPETISIYGTALDIHCRCQRQ